MSYDHEEIRVFLGEWKFLCSTRRNSRFEHGSVIVHNILAYFALSLNAAQVYMIQERCWFSQINFFIEYFPHRIKILFLSSQFLCHPHTQIRIILFHDERRDIPKLGTFSQPCFSRIFSNCFSHNSPAKG